MRHARSIVLVALALALYSCDSRRGRVDIEGEFQNLDQAQFLIYSPDGAFPDIDTLQLSKGRFQHQLAVSGGPYNFVIIYPNYQTLTFHASEGDKISIEGDALALADVVVKGCKNEDPNPSSLTSNPSPLTTHHPRNGNTTLRCDAFCSEAKPFVLIAFWANWKGGTTSALNHLRQAASDYDEQLSAVAYSLDTDPTLYRSARIPEGVTSFCDFLGWDSPAVRQQGVDRLPYFLLVDAKGTIRARGADYAKDILPVLDKVMKR